MKRDRPCASSLTALTLWKASPQSKRRTGRWAPGSRARTSKLWVGSSSVTSDVPQSPATRYASTATCSSWRRSTVPGSPGSWRERKLRSAARGGYHHVATNPEDPTSGSVAPRAWPNHQLGGTRLARRDPRGGSVVPRVGNRGQPGSLRLARRDGAWWSATEAHAGGRLVHLLIASTFTALAAGVWYALSFEVRPRSSSPELFESTNFGEHLFHALR